MDSLTQMTLGAAVGAAVAGKSHGRKAVLIGAICGTIPDLDVFYDYGDPVSNFTYHRGLTHSILFAVLATPLFVWILSCLKWFGVQFKDKRIHAAVFLMFLTHMLLDAMTIYGTQLFWPLPFEPVGVGSIFIIDPFYTVPLLLGVIWFLCNQSWEVNKIGLVVSTFYLLFSVSAQNSVRDIALAGMDEKPSHILVQPTPFNTVLWRVLVMTKDGYKVGYYSLFDKNEIIQYKNFKSERALLEPLKDGWAVQRLQWFTKGFYGVRVIDGKPVMMDLRMGLEPDQYVFQFTVPDKGRVTGTRDMSRIFKVWDRIWDEDVAF